MKVGNDVHTLFWTDRWVEKVPLSVRFKGKSVAKMFSLGWDQLFAWEEQLIEECRVVLLDVSLQVNIPDEWMWRPNKGDGYTVREVYQMLTRQKDHNLDAILDSVWHKQVPLKISTCVWCLIHNKLPTKDNLVIRDTIPQENYYCLSGCGQVESAQHLFLHYKVFSSLWRLVWSWIAFSSTEPQLILDRFI